MDCPCASHISPAGWQELGRLIRISNAPLAVAVTRGATLAFPPPGAHLDYPYMATKKSTAVKKPVNHRKRSSKRPPGNAPSRKVATKASTRYVRGYKPKFTAIELPGVRALSKYGGWDIARKTWTPIRFAEILAHYHKRTRATASAAFVLPEIAVLDALTLAVEQGRFPELTDEAASVGEIFATPEDLAIWADKISTEHELYWLHDRHFRALFESFGREEGFTTYPEVAQSLLDMVDW